MEGEAKNSLDIEKYNEMEVFDEDGEFIETTTAEQQLNLGRKISEMLINHETEEVFFRVEADIVPRKEMIQKDPLEVIKFYEERLKLIIEK